MRAVGRLLGLLLAFCLLGAQSSVAAWAGEGGFAGLDRIRDLRESADGRHLLVLADDGLHRLPLDGGGDRATYALPSGHRSLAPLAEPGKTLLLGERPGVHDAATGRVSGLSLPFVGRLADGGDLVILSDRHSMIFGLDRHGMWRGAMPLDTAGAGGVRRIAVAADGRRVAVVDGRGGLRLVDFAARTDLADVPGGATPVAALGFVGGDGEIAVVQADGRIVMRDGRDGREMRTLVPTKPQEVVDAAVGGDAIHLIGRDGEITARRTSDGAEIWSRGPDRRVARLRLSKDGATLFAFGERAVAVLDARTGAPRRFDPPTAEVRAVAPVGDATRRANPERARLFVVALGVDRYAREDRRLAHAVADARAVVDLFEARAAKGFASVETTLLVDDAVTDAALEALFAKLAASMTARDALVVHVAGHGRLLDGGFHLVPAAVDPDDDEAVRASGIRRARWDWWLSRLPIAHGLLIVDTCESGRAGRRNLLTRRAALSLDRRGGFTPMPGLSIVTATSDYGQALDAVEGHGAVVTALMAAPSAADTNGDGAIDVGELARFLARAAPETTQRSLGWRQELRVSLDRPGWQVFEAGER